jgi:hypothetical protein
MATLAALATPHVLAQSTIASIEELGSLRPRALAILAPAA